MVSGREAPRRHENFIGRVLETFRKLFLRAEFYDLPRRAGQCAVGALQTEMDKNDELNRQSRPVTGIEVPGLRGNTTLWAAFLMMFIISAR